MKLRTHRPGLNGQHRREHAGCGGQAPGKIPHCWHSPPTRTGLCCWACRCIGSRNAVLVDHSALWSCGGLAGRRSSNRGAWRVPRPFFGCPPTTKDCVMALSSARPGCHPPWPSARREALALANKESLVMSGPLSWSPPGFGRDADPIDSEHNAGFPCMTPGSPRAYGLRWSAQICSPHRVVSFWRASAAAMGAGDTRARPAPIPSGHGAKSRGSADAADRA